MALFPISLRVPSSPKRLMASFPFFWRRANPCAYSMRWRQIRCAHWANRSGNEEQRAKVEWGRSRTLVEKPERTCLLLRRSDSSGIFEKLRRLSRRHTWRGSGPAFPHRCVAVGVRSGIRKLPILAGPGAWDLDDAEWGQSGVVQRSGRKCFERVATRLNRFVELRKASSICPPSGLRMNPESSDRGQGGLLVLPGR